MLVDLLKNPDFVLFTDEIEKKIVSHKVELERAASWDEVLRAQGAIAALRAVQNIPNSIIDAAKRAASNSTRKRQSF